MDIWRSVVMEYQSEKTDFLLKPLVLNAIGNGEFRNGVYAVSR